MGEFACPIPFFDPERDDYSIWKKEAQLWDNSTSLAKSKRGAALFLKLKGRASTVIDNLENSVLTSDTGVEQILNLLDEKFLPDLFDKEFWPLHDLFTFRKMQDMPMADYLIHFEQKLRKFEETNDHLSDVVKAYKLLSSAGLTDTQIEIVKAGLGSTRTYENMKNILKKLYVVNRN